jgi:hypothetical protein
VSSVRIDVQPGGFDGSKVRRLKHQGRRWRVASPGDETLALELDLLFRGADFGQLNIFIYSSIIIAVDLGQNEDKECIMAFLAHPVSSLPLQGNLCVPSSCL